MVQIVIESSFDLLFQPAHLLHSMMEGSARLGVSFHAKDKVPKAELVLLAIGCIAADVMDPAIYDVDLPLCKLVIGVVTGTASEALWLAFSG